MLFTTQNIIVGEICHIEAANPGGQRFNEDTTDEQRRSYENLLLLCRTHHKETDDVVTYNTNTLLEIKRQHESMHGEKPFKINESFLYRLETEMQAYWNKIELANAKHHVAPEFSVKLDVGLLATKQFAEIGAVVDRIAELLSYFAKTDETLNDEIRLRIPAIVTAHSKFIVTDKLLMLEG